MHMLITAAMAAVQIRGVSMVARPRHWLGFDGGPSTAMGIFEDKQLGVAGADSRDTAQGEVARLRRCPEVSSRRLVATRVPAQA
jgi:hypothetical protein